MSDGSNPFAPPVAEVADVVAEGRPDLATRWSRLGAALADIVLQIGALAAIQALTPLTVFSSDDSVGNLVVVQLVSLLAFLALHGWMLVRHGQTLGKRLLGIRIVRPDGRRVAAGRLIGLRYVLGFVVGSLPGIGPLFGLIDALLIFRADRRCLHDVIADTIVVRA